VVLLGPLVASDAQVASADVGPAVHIVMQLASPSMRAAAVASDLSASVASELPARRALLTVRQGRVAETLAALRADRRVTYAGLTKIWRAADLPAASVVHAALSNAPNDTYYPTSQGNLATIDDPAAWTVTHGSVAVAVLDTGVDTLNPDLAAVTGETLCTNSGACTAWSNDAAGHGSHVSGIVGAATNNAAGVASVGWATPVKMFKVLGDLGDGSTVDIASGIYNATNEGFRVINMSLSNSSCSADPANCGPDPDTQNAVQYALGHGVVVVAAAGNEGFNDVTYPGAYPGVVAVGATDDASRTTYFSQWGSWVKIAAPGLDVLSTWNGQAQQPGEGTCIDSPTDDYCTLSGTSMASPHVAAAAALVLSVNPGLTGPAAVSRLLLTESPLAGGNPLGGGVLDAGRAVGAALDPSWGPNVDGYVMADTAGRAYAFGAYPYVGGMQGTPLVQPVVAVATNPTRTGYWMAAADGGLFAFNTPFFGSIGGHVLFRPVVGMAGTHDAGGYWEVASDGGIFAYGDAPFLGSTGGRVLFRPVVGMTPTPSGHGYWLVASDGGIFAYGDAAFYGSTGGHVLTSPVVGMSPTPTGHGYWLFAADGGVFAFGDAAFLGSLGGLAIPAPIAAVAS